MYRNQGYPPNRGDVFAASAYFQEKGLPPGLVGEDVESWYVQRSAVGPKVLRPRELRPFFGDVCNVADDALANFKDGRNLDISDKLTMLAMENVAVFLLGVRFGLTGASPDPKARELADAVTGRFSAESKLLFSIPFYEYFKTPTVKVLHRSLDKEMELTAYFMNETSQMRTPLTSKCIVHRLAEEGKISENEMFQVVGGYVRGRCSHNSW